MSKFITLGVGANKIVINKQDIVNIKKELNNRVEINYRNSDYEGENPYIIEAISFAMSEYEYQNLINELEKD